MVFQRHANINVTITKPKAIFGGTKEKQSCACGKRQQQLNINNIAVIQTKQPVCRAGGQGFKPQTGPTFGVLSYRGDRAAFAMTSTNG